MLNRGGDICIEVSICSWLTQILSWSGSAWSLQFVSYMAIPCDGPPLCLLSFSVTLNRKEKCRIVVLFSNKNVHHTRIRTVVMFGSISMELAGVGFWLGSIGPR